MMAEVSCVSSFGAVEYRSQEPTKATARTMNGIIFFLKIILFIQIQSQRTCVNVRFGSQAALQANNSPTAASGGKAVVQKTNYQNPKLNVRFHQ